MSLTEAAATIESLSLATLGTQAAEEVAVSTLHLCVPPCTSNPLIL